jgi:hypothetical protein
MTGLMPHPGNTPRYKVTETLYILGQCVFVWHIKPQNNLYYKFVTGLMPTRNTPRYKVAAHRSAPRSRSYNTINSKQ